MSKKGSVACLETSTLDTSLDRKEGLDCEYRPKRVVQDLHGMSKGIFLGER